jgi:hypothetical protein
MHRHTREAEEFELSVERSIRLARDSNSKQVAIACRTLKRAKYLSTCASSTMSSARAPRYR